MPHLLPLIWFIIVLAEIALYIILDGANLGIGILSIIPQKEASRSLFLHLIGPMWDANETWLLVAAGTLFGAFPSVFAVALNALYVPGVILLIGIILRAVSFEFYDYAVRKHIWSTFFGIGSLLVAIGQGTLLGGIFSGITISGGHFAGTPWAWMTPFTLFFIIGVISSYMVLGDAYLIRKTGKEFPHEPFTRVLWFIFIAAGSFVLAAFLLRGAMLSFFLSRWVTAPTSIILPTLAALAAIVALVLVIQTYRRKGAQHLYWYVLGVLVLGYAGVASALFPYIIPPDVAYWTVASPASTLIFMLWGIGPILPIVLLYNWYLAYIFRRQPDTPRRVAAYDNDTPTY